jgi:predicted ATPase/class 3 adenylate cyclase
VALPAGTVTFLFTDIEGSTDLLRAHGEAYAGLLAEHRRVLRASFTAHGGTEVDTQGDAFFVAFGRATDAVAAAADAQAGLAAGPVRVRMGLHTGEPIVADEGYVGMSVHRAARVASAAHGGQILVSSSTRELLVDADAELRDLGEHRLKDLAAPQRLYQLGAGEFPPPRSLDVARTNLPLQPTRLIGREREVADALALLADEDVRLLTLTGPGGVGKTRLALEVAAEAVEQFPHGVWFAPFADLDDPGRIRSRIAEALSLRDEAALEPFLRDRRLLLVLDNLEQLAGAAAGIGELLRVAPEVRVVAATRSSLRLTGEQEYPVPPLGSVAARSLFARRARAVQPDFALDGDAAIVDEICARLDRLPLAIELAAARTKMMTPAALLERLTERLPLLVARAVDVPERQRTLRGAIAWSYELLDRDERALFRSLAVFAGGFTTEAADAVARVPDAFALLESLFDKSLIVRRDGDRFDLLETIREFALERLRDEGDEDATRERHARHYAAVGDRTRAAAASGAWELLGTLLPERDNVREAIAWSRDAGRDDLFVDVVAANVGGALVASVDEGARLAARGLTVVGDTRPRRRASLLRLAARSHLLRGNARRALACADERLELVRALEDPYELGWALHDRAVARKGDGDDVGAEADFRAAVETFDRAGIDVPVIRADLAVEAAARGDLAGAEAGLSAALASARLGGGHRVPFIAASLAAVLVALGRLDEARELIELALPPLWSRGSSAASACVELLATIALERGDARQAASLLATGAELDRAAGIVIPNRDAHEVELRDRTASRALGLLGRDAFAAAQQDGRRVAGRFDPGLVLGDD